MQFYWKNHLGMSIFSLKISKHDYHKIQSPMNARMPVGPTSIFFEIKRIIVECRVVQIVVIYVKKEKMCAMNVVVECTVKDVS